MATGLGDEQLWLCPSLDNVTPFNDLSSQGNNGTAQGGLSTIADTGSGGAYAYDLNGTNNYIDVPSSGVPASAYTVSLWQYSTSSAVTTAFNAGDASGNRTVNIDGIRAGLSGDNHGHKRGGTSYWANNPTVRTSATWYHYLLTYDGSELRLYVDGVYTALRTGVQDTDYTESRCWVGQYAGGGSFFQGRIDDIRTYGRVLTQSEITHLATARGIEGRPFDGLGDEQLWLCPSLENSPNDLSGNNNNGVYQNGMGTVADTAEGGSLAYDLAVNEDRIEISGIGSNWRSSGAWTISMWIKGMASQGNQHLVANGNVNLYRGSTSGENIQSQQLNPYSGTGYTATGVATGVWYHLTCTSDGTNMKMFANGVEFKSIAAGLATSNTGIMSFGSTAAQSPNGSPIVRLDDIRAYDRALTQSEISWLSTERGVLGTPPEGLGDEQLWLCPSIQDSPNDISANNNHGTYVGGAGTVSDVAEGGTRSYEFTNSSHYITGTADLDTTDDFSLSYWYRSNAGNSFGTNYHIFRARNGTRGFNFYKYYSSGTQTYTGTTICRGGASSNSSTPVNYGITTSDWLDWHCFTMNWDNASSTMEYFIDGVSVGTWNASVIGSVDATGTTMILGALGNGTGTANGYIDDLRKYSRKLTQSEISWLSTERGVLGTPPEGLGDEQLWLCPSIDDSPNDISGNGNDGTYVGGMGTVTSDGKLCYDFDGSNDYIDLNDQWNFVGNYSYSLWINKDSGASVQVIGNRDTNADGWLAYINGSNVLRSYNDTAATSSSTPVISNSTWYCIAVTYDGTNLSVYKNGVLDSFVAASQQTASTRNAEIGRYTNNAAYNGQIDDVRFYNRVLTQAEITHLASQRGVEGPPPVGLGGEKLWLCPSLNDSVNDISGSGNDGTYQGGMGTVSDVSAGGSRAYDFDGIGDYIDCGSGFNPSTNLSLSAWVNADTWSGDPSNVRTIIEKGFDGANEKFSMGSRSNGSYLDLYTYISPAERGIESQVAPPSTANWHHVCGTFDGSTWRLFFNGVQVASDADSTALPSSTQAVSIGATKVNGSPERYFSGKMDDIRTYDRAITQSEITHLATSRGVLGSPTTTTQYNAFITHAFKQLFQTRLR